MSDEVISVSTRIVEQIQNAAREFSGKYVMDSDICNKVLSVYDKFKVLAHVNDGGIKVISVRNIDRVRLIAEMPTIDLYSDSLALFSEILLLADSLDINATRDDCLIVEIGVEGLWKAV